MDDHSCQAQQRHQRYACGQLLHFLQSLTKLVFVGDAVTIGADLPAGHQGSPDMQLLPAVCRACVQLSELCCDCAQVAVVTAW
jgi:hypothetical protein